MYGESNVALDSSVIRGEYDLNDFHFRVHLKSREYHYLECIHQCDADEKPSIMNVAMCIVLVMVQLVRFEEFFLRRNLFLNSL